MKDRIGTKPFRLLFSSSIDTYTLFSCLLFIFNNFSNSFSYWASLSNLLFVSLIVEYRLKFLRNKSVFIAGLWRRNAHLSTVCCVSFSHDKCFSLGCFSTVIKSSKLDLLRKILLEILFISNVEFRLDVDKR